MILRIAAAAISLLVFAAGIALLSIGIDDAFFGVGGAAYVIFSAVALWLLVQSSSRNIKPSFSAKVRPRLGLFCATLPLITLFLSLDLGIISSLEWAGVAFAGLLALVIFLALRASFSTEAVGA